MAKAEKKKRLVVLLSPPDHYALMVYCARTNDKIGALMRRLALKHIAKRNGGTNG